MKDFRFSKQITPEEKDIERILRRRKRKFVKQQVIYSAILIFIIGMIAVWLFNKAAYADFDGYISADVNELRPDDDIYSLETKYRIGDLIVPGDTLFSYVIAHNFYSHEVSLDEPTVIVNNRNRELDYRLAREEIGVIAVRIRELERQLKTQDNNIRFGLSDNHNKLRIEQQLAEAKEQYRAQSGKIAALRKAAMETRESLKRLNNEGHRFLTATDVSDTDLLKKIGLVRYSIAIDSAIVTKKHVPSFSLVLKGEKIMNIQSLDLLRNNLTAVAYVMPDQMDDINYYSKATITVNNEVSFKANVMMLGARTEELPGELRSTFSRDHTSIIVVFDLDPDQNIPFWALTDRVPVRIRIPKFSKKETHRDDYIIYNTSTGVVRESLDYVRKKSRHEPYGKTLRKDSLKTEKTDE